LPDFKEITITYVFLPNSENFGQSIALEERYVGDDVEESRFVHPVGETHHLSRQQILTTLSFELFFGAFRVDLDNPVRGDGIVLIKSTFLLVFITCDDLKIIRSKHLQIDLLNAVYELDRRRIPVLREERNSHVACLDRLKDVIHRFVDEKSILNFVLGLLGAFAIEALHDLGVVRLRWLSLGGLVLFLADLRCLIET
jgi:hypothetical protein